MWNQCLSLLSWFAAFALSFSCGTEPSKLKSPTLSSETRRKLQQKYEKYQAMAATREDDHGFIEYAACDSLLFTSLYGITTSSVSIEAARDESGSWHRRPYPANCYPENSKSTISRDMFIGLFYFIWYNRRLDLAEQIFEYGKSHNWKMGEGDPSRIYLSPALQATLAEIIYRLGGKNYEAYRLMPIFITKYNKGFAAHLDVLLIFLRAELTGTMPKSHLEVVATHYQRSPRNAFFSLAYHAYTDGNFEPAAATLLDEQLFPSDRLPTSQDRSEGWLWQREDGSDWEPNPSADHTHTGADLLFVAFLISRR